MTDYEVISRYKELEDRAFDLDLHISTGANSFLVQNKALKILSTPKTLDGVGAFFDAAEYASRKSFNGFN